MTMTHRPYHFVAIVGGAIAGSVAAEILADNGIHVVVIEQNKKPYGKIEDGLPRWHLEQRKQEYSRIDARLRKPGVSSFPALGSAATSTFTIFATIGVFLRSSWRTGRGRTENWEFLERKNSSTRVWFTRIRSSIGTTTRMKRTTQGHATRLLTKPWS